MANDTLLLSEETNEYISDCYKPDSELSESFLQAKYNANKFEHNQFINWGMFVSAKNEVFKQIIMNAVEIIRREYLRTPITLVLTSDLRFKVILCTTGPGLLSSTLRKMILEHENNRSVSMNAFPLRSVPQDFKMYGGSYKQWGYEPVDGRNNERHYIQIWQIVNPKILKHYADDNATVVDPCRPMRGNWLQSKNGKKNLVVLKSPVDVSPHKNPYEIGTIFWSPLDKWISAYAPMWDIINWQLTRYVNRTNNHINTGVDAQHNSMHSHLH